MNSPSVVKFKKRLCKPWWVDFVWVIWKHHKYKATDIVQHLGIYGSMHVIFVELNTWRQTGFSCFTYISYSVCTYQCVQSVSLVLMELMGVYPHWTGGVYINASGYKTPQIPTHWACMSKLPANNCVRHPLISTKIFLLVMVIKW